MRCTDRRMRIGVGLVATLTMTACGAAHPAAATAAGGSCAPGQATTAAVLTVPKEPPGGVQAPSGKCWAQIAGTPITNVVIGTAAPAGTSATERVAWSPQNLYVLASVQEWPLPTGGASLWNSQTVEFYVSGNNDKAGAFGPQDGQFGILVGTPGVSNGTDKLSGEPTGLQQIIANKGYQAELVVPWSMLGVSAPAAGQEYKFDVAVDFGNSSGTQTAQTMWVGGQNNYQSTAEWGSITLGS